MWQKLGIKTPQYYVDIIDRINSTYFPGAIVGVNNNKGTPKQY